MYVYIYICVYVCMYICYDIPSPRNLSARINPRFIASPSPPFPTLLQYDCTTIALCTTPPPTPFCMAYTIQHW